MGQPASALASMTFFCGESIFTVSAIKRTPHMTTVDCGAVLAFTDRA